jgi:hypothetical protein
MHKVVTHQYLGVVWQLVACRLDWCWPAVLRAYPEGFHIHICIHDRTFGSRGKNVNVRNVIPLFTYSRRDWTWGRREHKLTGIEIRLLLIGLVLLELAHRLLQTYQIMAVENDLLYSKQKKKNRKMKLPINPVMTHPIPGVILNKWVTVLGSSSLSYERPSKSICLSPSQGILQKHVLMTHRYFFLGSHDTAVVSSDSHRRLSGIRDGLEGVFHLI